MHTLTLPRLAGYVEVSGGRYKCLSTGQTYLPTEIPEQEPTTEDDLMSMSIDHELRLSLLEMGVM